MQRLYLVSGQVTFPAGALTPLVVNAGDTLVLPQWSAGAKGRLLNFWTNHQQPGVVRITSNNFDNTVSGIEVDQVAANCRPLLPFGFSEPLYSGDNSIAVVINAPLSLAGDVQLFSALIQLDNAPGGSNQYLTAQNVATLKQHMLSVRYAVPCALLNGQYEAGVALSAPIAGPVLKSDQDAEYAIIGGHIDVGFCGTVAIQSSIWGNDRFGFPADPWSKDVTANWFRDQSLYHGLPLIPKFKGANAPLINLSVTSNETGAAGALVTLIFAKLNPVIS